MKEENKWQSCADSVLNQSKSLEKQGGDSGFRSYYEEFHLTSDSNTVLILILLSNMCPFEEHKKKYYLPYNFNI